MLDHLSYVNSACPGSGAALLQRFLNFSDKLILGEGFLGNLQAFERAMAQHRLTGVTRHIEHLDSGALAGYASKNLGTAHSRQHDIGQQQIDVPWILLEESPRLLVTVGLQYHVTCVVEHPVSHLPHRRLILHQQDGRGAFGGRYRWLRRGWFGRLLHNRKVEPEGRTLVRLAFDVYRATALLHDS